MSGASDLVIAASGGPALAHGLAERIHATDWSTTSLGPADRWPQSLRTALSICLGAPVPMLILWGPDQVQLYNDAFAPFFGSDPYAALGHDGRHSWATYWQVIGPLCDRVRAGEGCGSIELSVSFDRDGSRVESTVTLAFGPISDETDQVAGVLATVAMPAGQPVCTLLGRVTADGHTILDDGTATGYRMFTQPAAALYHDAEAALREREHQLRTVLEALPVGVWLTDAGGSILLDNAASGRIWGIRQSGREHIGVCRGWSPESGRELLPEEWSLFRALHHGETALNEMIDIEAFDGARKTILSSAMPVRDKNGTITGAVVVNEDITAVRRAELERERLLADEQAARTATEVARERLAFLARAGATLADSLDIDTTLRNIARLAVPALADWCDIFTGNDDGTFTVQASAFRDVDHLPLLEEMHRRYPPRPDTPGGIAEVARTGVPVVVPDVTVREVAALAEDDGEQSLLAALELRSYMFVPLTSRGTNHGVLALGMTGSGRRFSDADLYLAVEIAERAAQAIGNAHLYREARDAVQVRDHVLTTVTHDLRNPLTTIKGFAQIMQRQTARAKLTPEALANGLAQMHDAAEKMSGMIDDLLDTARLQMGQPLSLQVGPAELLALTRRAVENHRRTTSRHTLVLDTDGQPITGEFDGPRLERVLDNLLSNAIKYSPAGGEVRVTLRRAEADSRDVAVISVSDRGMGIPAADQWRIFQPFQRASNVAGRIAGTGIGLAGARRIIEQHGGLIRVESTEGEGSTFTVVLPLDGQRAAGSGQRD